MGHTGVAWSVGRHRRRYEWNGHLDFLSLFFSLRVISFCLSELQCCPVSTHVRPCPLIINAPHAAPCRAMLIPMSCPPMPPMPPSRATCRLLCGQKSEIHPSLGYFSSAISANSLKRLRVLDLRYPIITSRPVPHAYICIYRVADLVKGGVCGLGRGTGDNRVAASRIVRWGGRGHR